MFLEMQNLTALEYLVFSAQMPVNFVFFFLACFVDFLRIIHVTQKS